MKEEKGIQMNIVAFQQQHIIISCANDDEFVKVGKHKFASQICVFQRIWKIPKLVCPQNLSPQIFSPPKIFSTPLPPEGGQGGSNLATFDWFELLQKFQKCLIATIGPFGANIWHPQIFCNFATAQRIWKIPKPSDP